MQEASAALFTAFPVKVNTRCTLEDHVGYSDADDLWRPLRRQVLYSQGQQEVGRVARSSCHRAGRSPPTSRRATGSQASVARSASLEMPSARSTACNDDASRRAANLSNAPQPRQPQVATPSPEFLPLLLQMIQECQEPSRVRCRPSRSAPWAASCRDWCKTGVRRSLIPSSHFPRDTNRSVGYRGDSEKDRMSAEGGISLPEFYQDDFYRRAVNKSPAAQRPVGLRR